VSGDRLAPSFWERVDRGSDDEGCWTWMGTKTPDGYGVFYDVRVKGSRRAHRVAYEALVGPIPNGLQIDHLCRTRNCVNPTHMEAVSSRVNTLRGEGPTASKYRQTHCVNGHEFTPENTKIRSNGIHRQCRECMRITDRKKRKRGTAEERRIKWREAKRRTRANHRLARLDSGAAEENT
jgi:hypothetical protein